MDASRHVAFYEGAWTESTPLFMLCKLPPNSQHQPAICSDDIAHIDDSLNGPMTTVCMHDCVCL